MKACPILTEEIPKKNPVGGMHPNPTTTREMWAICLVFISIKS